MFLHPTPFSLRAIAGAFITLIAVAAAAAESGQQAVRPELAAGDMRAIVTASNQTAPLGAGSPAFISIRVIAGAVAGPVSAPAKSGGRRVQRAPAPPALPVTLLFEAENGEIRGVSGESVSMLGGGAAASATVAMRPDAERTVLVELLPKANPDGGPSRLKVVLKNADGAASDPAELTWLVKDCAGGFHAALRGIAEGGGAEASRVIAALRSPDKALPRSAIFRPGAAASGRAAGGCARYRRERDPFTGEWSRVCARYGKAPREAPAASPKTAFPEERAIQMRAAALLRQGGADPQLGKNGALSWASGKAADDLRLYLEQRPHPALCTGAQEFSDTYAVKIRDLKAHAERFLALAEKSRELAAFRTGEAVAAMQAREGGGHPGIGAAPLIGSGEGQADAGLRSLILRLAPYAGFEGERLSSLQSEPNEIAMLTAVRGGLDAGNLPKDISGILVPALAAIEASAHLSLSEARYRAVVTQFAGSFESIRDAHAKQCTCGA